MAPFAVIVPPFAINVPVPVPEERVILPFEEIALLLASNKESPLVDSTIDPAFTALLVTVRVVSGSPATGFPAIGANFNSPVTFNNPLLVILIVDLMGKRPS